MKKILLSALTCGLLLSTTSIQAKSDTKTLVQQQIKKNKKSFKQAPKEILEALNQTSLAVQSLQQNEMDDAKKYLKNATENFDKALNASPELDILPLDESIEVYENTASPKEIISSITLAKSSLDKYNLNAARAALLPLRDEMYIKTISIPMKIFPLATKNALNAVNKGNTQQAMTFLAEGYNTFIIEEAVIPLPLLAAQDMIAEAVVLDKNDKEAAIKLLDDAQKELEKAKVLGYTNSKTPEYKALNHLIDNVKKEIKGKNEIVKIYDKLKESFISLIHKSKIDTHKKTELKVNTYKNKEAHKSVNDTGNFNIESKQDKAKTIKK